MNTYLRSFDSRPTFVMDGNDPETLWNSSHLTFTHKLRHKDKLSGYIKIEPEQSIALIDHFEVYIDDVQQAEFLRSKDACFPVYIPFSDIMRKLTIIASPATHFTHTKKIQLEMSVRILMHKIIFTLHIRYANTLMVLC